VCADLVWVSTGDRGFRDDDRGNGGRCRKGPVEAVLDVVMRKCRGSKVCVGATAD